MVHADTHSGMVLLADIDEGHELRLDLLQFGGILLVGIFEVLESAPGINVITRIDAHLLTVEGCDIGSMGCEVDISHKGSRIAIGLQARRDILHVLGLACALCGEAYEFATCIDDALCLGHTALCIIGIYRSHRLDTDGVGASDADVADTGLCAKTSFVHILEFARLITLEIILQTCELFVGFLDLDAKVSLIDGEALSQISIAQGKHLHGEDGCILCAIHTHGGYRDARRHLDDREHGIETVEHALDGYADDGQCGAGCYHARKGCRHTGSGNDHLDATILGCARKGLNGIGGAMGGEGIDFERYLHLIEQLTGFLHNGQVARAAHDNTD